MTAVSRETVGDSRSPSYGRVRDRASDGRTRKGDARRAVVIEAVLASCRDGNFRPGLDELVRRSGIPKGSIIKLFGALPLIYRIVARERPDEVADAGRHAAGGVVGLKEFAWLIMVGQSRDLP